MCFFFFSGFCFFALKLKKEVKQRCSPDQTRTTVWKAPLTDPRGKAAPRQTRSCQESYKNVLELPDPSAVLLPLSFPCFCDESVERSSGKSMAKSSKY